jgi:protein SDA1
MSSSSGTSGGPKNPSTKNHFATNLLQLQNFIKRDASSYRDEFFQTYHNYESTLQVYLMKPSKPNKQLADLTLFIAHVSHCFPEELKTYPQQLIDILRKYSTVLNSEMRLTFCKCLMLIRSKNLIEPIPLIETFFTLIKCQDKQLRKTLFEHILNDIKKIKTKLKNYKLCSVN